MAEQFASNTNQLRCECGRFISVDAVEYSSTSTFWVCGRCGPRRKYVGGD